ncbi:MAG TPA: Cys-tRNA(Pro) deacylase [Bacillota bacterium]
MKTVAARILDDLGIAYELRAYDWNEEELDAVTVAGQIGLPPGQVFKTLVARGDRTGVVVACLPGDQELDLKALGAISGNKKVEMVPVKEIQALTGYVRGGVSPLGMRRTHPFFIDETAEIIDPLAVSAGQRGLQIILAGPDLIRATEARPAALTRGR